MHKQGCQIHVNFIQSADSAELKCFVQGLLNLAEILLLHFVLSLLG